MWAKPCKDWTNNGSCSRGVSCHFAHAGFPISEKRCITCGKKDHGSKECTAPGGGKDPNHDASWDEYRKRKEKEAPSKGKGKGGGKGKGKGGGGKGKGKGANPKGDKAQAKAARDIEVIRASATRVDTVFPRDCIGLDTWANVHMIHKKQNAKSQFKDDLQTTWGSRPGS